MVNCIELSRKCENINWAIGILISQSTKIFTTIKTSIETRLPQNFESEVKFSEKLFVSQYTLSKKQTKKQKYK